MKYNLFEKEKDLTYELSDKIIEDCVYELEEDRTIFPIYNILNEEESFKLIKNYPKSFCRFGDGEIQIMKGYDQPFQEYDPVLAKRLKEILGQHNDNIYVGINRAYFHSPVNCSDANRRFYRLYSASYRHFFREYCSVERIYLDAGFLGAYYRFTEAYDYEKHYNNVVSLFENKNVAIVSGEGVIEKLKYDVFSRAKNKIIIHGLAINAFSDYDNLLQKITSQVSKDYLICVILGMTAKVLVADLTELGYMAWDVGHMAKDYDAYMNRTEKTPENITNFWAPD